MGLHYAFFAEKYRSLGVDDQRQKNLVVRVLTLDLIHSNTSSFIFFVLKKWREDGNRKGGSRKTS